MIKQLVLASVISATTASVTTFFVKERFSAKSYHIYSASSKFGGYFSYEADPELVLTKDRTMILSSDSIIFADKKGRVSFAIGTDKDGNAFMSFTDPANPGRHRLVDFNGAQIVQSDFN